MKKQSVLGIVLMVGGGLLVAALIGNTANDKSANPTFATNPTTEPAVVPRQAEENEEARLTEAQQAKRVQQMEEDQRRAVEEVEAAEKRRIEELEQAKADSEVFNSKLQVQARPETPAPAPTTPKAVAENKTAAEKQMAAKLAAEKVAKERIERERQSAIKKEAERREAEKTALAKQQAEKRASENRTEVAKTAPAPQPAQSAQPTAGAGTHLVEKGETLGAIAKQYGVSLDSLAKANKMGRDGTLYAGKTLRLPAGASKQAEAVKAEPKPAPKPAEVAKAEPKPEPKPAPKSEPVRTSGDSHTIKVGDTLGHLAKQYGVSVDDIAKANGMGRDDMLAEGRVIKLPAGAKRSEAKTERPAVKAETKSEPKAEKPKATVKSADSHTIKVGDTLGHLAKQYGVSVDDIAKANGMGRDDTLSEGRVLKIPSKK